DQKSTSNNPRSTVGTVTEIYDYLRLLWARIGIPHCPVCGREITQQTVDQMVDKILSLPERTKIQVMAPVVRGRKGTQQQELDSARRSGYVRVRVDGNMYDLSENITLEKNKKHSVDIVVDRLMVSPSIRSRLAGSIETALSLTGALVLIDVIDGEEMLFSQSYSCPEHGISVEELTPRMFSFNNPFGACPTCSGLSMFLRVSEDLLVPNRNLSINEGAIKGCGWGQSDKSTIAGMYYTALAEKYNFTFDTPFKDISKEGQDAIFYGTKGERMQVTRVNEYGSGTYMTDFEGIINNLERRHRETTSDWSRNDIEQYMVECPCPTCKGKRLKPASLAVTVGGKNIMEFTDMSVREELAFIEQIEETLSEKDRKIGKQIFKEIRSRLSFLCDVGLDYLTLSRSAGTLSGGESQRIRLATQIGSSLMGVLYILDEPSIGLHQRDNDKLLQSLKNLRDLGNTLIVVEHDEDTMNAADYIVDVGPGAGVHGGEIVFQGTVKDIKKCKESITGQYLSGKRKIEVPTTRRSGNGKSIVIKGAKENNLKNIDVEIPLGKFVAITGVSGSGKSSLINEILFKKLAAELNGARKFAGKHDEITGLEHLDKV
ncbi:MAG: excinuclease ABC subunit UvrA, partial [Clostridia bacterium]|nr:excinuclease ABC subunit UvrA [Clostridia bacterium]